MSGTHVAGSPVTQMPLFGDLCLCGRRPVEMRRLGICRLCYGAHRRNWHAAAGRRGFVMRRDRGCCRVCLRGGQLAVHCRRPGSRRRSDFIALCPACHAQVHHLRRLPHGVPHLLLQLWQEVHPTGRCQQQLDLGYPVRSARRDART